MSLSSMGQFLFIFPVLCEPSNFSLNTVLDNFVIATDILKFYSGTCEATQK